DHEIHTTAKRIFSNILHHYSDFNISTIDSFVHRIIRSFALELNLSYNFEVLLDTETYIELVLDQLFSSIDGNKFLTKLLFNYSKMLLEEGKSWHIEGQLADYIKVLIEENSIAPLTMLAASNVDFEQLRKENNIKKDKLEEALIQLSSEADAMIKSSLLPEEWFAYGKSGLYYLFENIINNKTYERLISVSDKKRFNSFLVEGEDFWKKKTPERYIDGFLQLQQQLTSFYNDIVTTKSEKYYSEYVLRNMINSSIYLMALNKEIFNAMEQVNLEENIIPIHAFNRLIYSITETQDVPYIYERTSERFNHFLIDEFQDTSALQWYNMQPLIVDSLANGGYNMVVGDAKQAIYRWRNGDVEQFVMLPAIKKARQNSIYLSRQNMLENFYKPETLKENYRSAAPIVHFNNNFFNFVKECFPGIVYEAYDNHEQHPCKNIDDGYVELTLLDTEKTDTKAQQTERHLTLLIEKIHHCLHDHYAPEDICVLTRTKHEASLVATKLVENSIRVVSEESLLLKNNKEFRFLSAYLGLLHNYDDKVHAVTIISWLHGLGHISGDELPVIIESLGRSKSRSVMHFVSSLLQQFFPSASAAHHRSLPLYEMCEQVIADFGLGDHAPLPSRYFLDMAGSFVSTFTPDLSVFVRWLDQQMRSKTIPLTGTTNAIQVMTIHKSKGLQFPVVLYPFAWEQDQPTGNKKSFVWVENPTPESWGGLPYFFLPLEQRLQHTPFADSFNKENAMRLLDMVNLIYVAFTRPKNRLYVISSKPTKSSSNNLYSLLKAYCQQNNFPETGTIVFGEAKITLKKQDKAEDKETSGMRWISGRWRKRISVKAKGMRDLNVKRSKALSHGNLLHRILAAIETRDDIDSAVARFHQQGWITADEA
ncbi:MAG: 3'-5' exonuclease, partial [Bacteroidales bacterium]|nr:3'-5' exonuclease [Bacteroidales bacterium]